MFLALTGTRLRGPELVQVGLANFFVKKTNIEKLERELVDCVGQNTTEEEIFQIVKRSSEKVSGEYAFSKQCEELFGGETLFEIMEKLKNDKKYKEFSGTCLKLMGEASSISLRIIFEGLKRGKTMTLSEVFNMEFRLTQRFLNNPKTKK